MKNLIETNKYNEEIRMNDKGRKIKGHSWPWIKEYPQ